MPQNHLKKRQKKIFPTHLFQKNYKKDLQHKRDLPKMRASQVVAMEKFLSTKF
jgi:hypothetical protein